MNPNDGTLLDVNKPLVFGDFEINDYNIYFQHAEVEKIGVEFLCGDLHNSTQAWVNEVGCIKDLESENVSYSESNILQSFDQITILDKYGSQENIEFFSEELPDTNEVNIEIKSPESTEIIKNRSTWASLFNSSTVENNSNGINNEKIVSVQMETKNLEVKNCITVVGMENDIRAIKLAKFISNLKIDFSCHHLQLRGLINRGNWCYINTTLQAFLAISPISHFYKSLKPFLNTDVSTSTPLTDSMIAFFNEFESINPKVSLKKQSEELKTGASFEPRCIYNVLTTMKATLSEKGRQEDAEEFLSYLLNGINDELAALNKLLTKKTENGNDEPELDNDNDDSSWSHVVTKKKELARKINQSSDSSIIKQIFGGMIRSSVQQSGVKESTTLQPFFTLQLDIQGDSIWCLGKAVEAYFVTEILQGFTCSKTNTEVEASRKLSIEELPLVLIFHLKYFVYDRTGGSQKIYKAIDIPVELEIPKDVLSPSLKVSLNDRQYRLSAVIHHHGKHAAGGHYTASVHHGSPFGWVNFDDNIIKTLSVNQVLRKQQGSVPYLLFYERVPR